jgi:hypothetical protein
MFKQHNSGYQAFHSIPRQDCHMTFIQLLIAGIVIAGIVMIGLLAIIPSLLEYPEGRDKDESEMPPPTPLKPNDRDHRSSSGLAA